MQIRDVALETGVPIILGEILSLTYHQRSAIFLRLSSSYSRISVQTMDPIQSTYL